MAGQWSWNLRDTGCQTVGLDFTYKAMGNRVLSRSKSKSKVIHWVKNRTLS